jgi:hypothetical protein
LEIKFQLIWFQKKKIWCVRAAAMPRDSGVCFQSAPLSPHTLGYVKRISTPVFLIDSLVDGVDFHVAEMDTTNIWGGKRNKK